MSFKFKKDNRNAANLLSCVDRLGYALSKTFADFRDKLFVDLHQRDQVFA